MRNINSEINLWK